MKPQTSKPGRSSRSNSLNSTTKRNRSNSSSDSFKFVRKIKYETRHGVYNFWIILIAALLVVTTKYLLFTLTGQQMILNLTNQSMKIRHPVFHNETFTSRNGTQISWFWVQEEPSESLANFFFNSKAYRKTQNLALIFNPNPHKTLADFYKKDILTSLKMVDYHGIAVDILQADNGEILNIDFDQVGDLLEEIIVKTNLRNYLENTAIVTNHKLACPTYGLAGHHQEVQMIIASNPNSCKETLQGTSSPVYFIDSFGEIRGGVDKVPNAHYVNITGYFEKFGVVLGGSEHPVTFSNAQQRFYEFVMTDYYKNLLQHLLLGHDYKSMDISINPIDQSSEVKVDHDDYEDLKL